MKWKVERNETCSRSWEINCNFFKMKRKNQNENTQNTITNSKKKCTWKKTQTCQQVSYLNMQIRIWSLGKSQKHENEPFHHF